MNQITEQKIFIGREKELRRAIQAFKQKKLILFTGEKGSGKTALVNELIKRLIVTQPNRMVLLASESASLKDTCLELIGNLYRLRALSKVPKTLSHLDLGLPWGKVKRLFEPLGVTVLKNLFLANVGGKDCVVIFDHLAKLKLKFFSFLDSLRDSAQLILVARSTDRKEMGRLWMMLWGFETIEIKPLPFHEASQLALHWLDKIDLEGSNRTKLIRELIRVSQGNPDTLHSLCGEVYKQSLKGSVNVRLADIDRRITQVIEAKEVDIDHAEMV